MKITISQAIANPTIGNRRAEGNDFDHEGRIWACMGKVRTCSEVKVLD